MFYFNVSNPQAGDFKQAFTYLDSHVGKKFYLDPSAFSASPNVLQLSLTYGTYISEDGNYDAVTGNWTRYEPFNETLANAVDPRTVYRNPFHIINENITDANIVCSGTGNGDKANITNVGVACGLMFGAATRTDGQHSLILSPGSWWRQPIYSCATALVADIKQVTFSWNTSIAEKIPLKKLRVDKIEDKVYRSKAEEPYWAVENLHRILNDNQPLWGLVSAETAKLYQNNEFINISHSSRLFIPGYVGDSSYMPSNIAPDSSNLAAANAFLDGLGQAYSVDVLSSSSSYYYTGGTSLSLFQKWQELSASVETAAKIPNLIWTDTMANAIVGTRSKLSDNSLPNNIQRKLRILRVGVTKRATAFGSSPTSTQAPINIYRNQVTYRWLYAIPALLTLALLTLILVIILGLTFVGTIAGPQTLEFFLNWTSAGRLLAMLKDQQSFAFPNNDPSYSPDASSAHPLTELSTQAMMTCKEHHMNLSSSQWMKTKGRRIINLDAISETHTNFNASSQTLHEKPSESLTVETITEQSSLNAVGEVEE